MPEDKLTRAERIRLECFAQAGARNPMRPLPLQQQFREAEEIEQWLKRAKETEQ